MKILKVLILALLALFNIYLTTQKIDLQTADLGRHIKNGEELLKGSSGVFSSNYYSYTNSNYPFLNHHWGSGVIFYLIQSLGGFNGQSIFFTTVSLITFLLFFDASRRYANFYTASFVSLLAIPLIGSRVEIRPEAFSYLFSGLFFWVLVHYQKDKLQKKWLFALPLSQIIWVNLHVYFPLGLLIIGAFLTENMVLFIFKKEKAYLTKIKFLSLIGVLTGVAALVNPYFIKGVLYPLNIFQDYGYRLLENQSFLFLEKLIVYPASLYFKVSLGVFILSLVFALYQSYKKRIELSVAVFLLSLFFLIMSFQAVRNFALFGYFLIPFLSNSLKTLKFEMEEEIKNFLTPTAYFGLFLILMVINQPYFASKSDFGIGLKDGAEKAAQFFLNNQLQGPVFNNYDIGGYLIYYLYPKEKVFVDNRPEAYPSEFFQKTYVPMQEDEKIFSVQDKKYNFNTIFFYRHDLTPWAQKFLINKIKDSNWVPVYVDNFSIIFVKNSPQNSQVIKQFKLPQEIFQTQNS